MTMMLSQNENFTLHSHVLSDAHWARRIGRWRDRQRLALWWTFWEENEDVAEEDKG